MRIHVAVPHGPMIAFEDAIRRNAPDLLAYLERRVDAPADAADALGDVLLVAWRRRRSLPTPPTEARMWLFGIARHTLLNVRRSEVRRSAAVRRLGTQIASLSEEPDDTEFPEVREAISRLSPDKAELVRLIHWDGFSIAEAAVIVGIPASTARSRYAAARHTLRELLAQHHQTPSALAAPQQS